MATHSSILARRIPWTEEPGRLSPWGCRVGHDWATNTLTLTFTLEKEWGRGRQCQEPALGSLPGLLCLTDPRTTWPSASGNCPQASISTGEVSPIRLPGCFTEKWRQAHGLRPYTRSDWWEPGVSGNDLLTLTLSIQPGGRAVARYRQSPGLNLAPTSFLRLRDWVTFLPAKALPQKQACALLVCK